MMARPQVTVKVKYVLKGVSSEINCNFIAVFFVT